MVVTVEYEAPVVDSPRERHATVASWLPKKSSQMVPQVPLLLERASRRPLLVVPSLRRYSHEVVDEAAVVAGAAVVVEDEEADRLMFKRVFRQFNRAGSVEFATSLANARNSLAVRKYDIIVLDNSLEDGKGADFILELSKNEELSSIPVVIVSDWPSPFMYAKAKSGNVLDVLTKDQFDVETLRRVMKAASLCD